MVRKSFTEPDVFCNRMDPAIKIILYEPDMIKITIRLHLTIKEQK